MSDTTPNSYVNMYRIKSTGKEFAGVLRFGDRSYAEHVGQVDTGFADYIGTVPSDDEPNTFDMRRPRD